METFLVWIKFLVCATMILVSGSKLAWYGDAIAEKTKLGGVWVGLLLLAIVTSMPELATGASAAALVGSADLALGTVFGSNLFNLLIIAVLDIIYRHGPLLSEVSRGQLASAGVSIMLIALAGGFILLSTLWSWGIGWMGLYSIALIILYLFGTRFIFRFERTHREESTEAPPRYHGVSSRRAYLGFTISALAIIGGGIWLATIGDEIAITTGWNATFVGSLFLAAISSFPELVVAIAALRLGAIDMAIADMLGSNMFNMSVVIASNDLFYHGGFILGAASVSHVLTAVVGILMTLLVITALIYRPRRKSPLGISWYAIGLIICYIVGAYTIFRIGAS